MIPSPRRRYPEGGNAGIPSLHCPSYSPHAPTDIRRSYVFYLETRLEQLEAILNSKGIPFPPADDLELCSRSGNDAASPLRPTTEFSAQEDGSDRASTKNPGLIDTSRAKKIPQGPGMLDIVSPSKPKSLATASGISFNRVVLAVQCSVSDENGTPGRAKGRIGAASDGTSMRDSFFGLHSKPTIQQATFPDKELGIKLLTLYFEHANPQIPILHRPEFMQMFERAYAEGKGEQVRGPRELYMLNMVFAIGCGVIVGEPVKPEAGGNNSRMAVDQDKPEQFQPEEYHASAIVQLDECMSSCSGGLEVLQAILLLANFALLRPVPPGLW